MGFRNRAAALVAILSLTLVGGPAVVCLAQKNAAALEQSYSKEKNPRKQADTARKLIALRMEQLRARVGTGVMLDDSTPELRDYAAALEMLAAAVRQASHKGTSKNAEKMLRDQSNELSNLEKAVSAAERPLVERLHSQATALREEILYGLMLPAQPQPKAAENEESARK